MREPYNTFNSVINSLSPEYRKCYKAYLAGWPIEYISKTFGIPPRTAEERVRLVKYKLKSKLKSKGLL